MNQQELSKFFESLGEIWRDINAIEYLMRVAIAQKDDEQHILPKAPFTQGRVYNEYPRAFAYSGLGKVVEKFKERFPDINLPANLVQLRNALAHGLIAELDFSGTIDIIKFREHTNNKTLEIEFSMPLDQQTLNRFRQKIKDFRRNIMTEVDDKNQPSGPAHT